MDDATRYFSINQTVFGSYFSLIPAIDQCTVNHYELQSEIGRPVPSGYARSLINSTFGTQFFKIDKTQSTETMQSVFLSARTKGFVNIQKKISWEVCKPTSLVLTSLAQTISGTYSRLFGENYRQVIQAGDYKPMFKVENCTQCTRLRYRLVNEDNTLFTGP